MRSKTLTILFAAAMLVATASPAVAQEGGGMRKGDIELGVNLTNTSTTGGASASTTMLILSPGYFFTPEHEAGALVLLMAISGDADASISFIRPFYRYNFAGVHPLLIPYLGAQVGSLSVKAAGTSNSATSYGVQGGVNYFLKENAAAYADYTYDTAKIAGTSSNSGTLTLGYKFYF